MKESTRGLKYTTELSLYLADRLFTVGREYDNIDVPIVLAVDRSFSYPRSAEGRLVPDEYEYSILG
jgi:hypothetical protein